MLPALEIIIKHLTNLYTLIKANGPAQVWVLSLAWLVFLRQILATANDACFQNDHCFKIIDINKIAKEL